LVRALRAGNFDRAVLLHHSHTLAFATLAAGIRVRQGYGFGAQRWLLNRGPYLPDPARRMHQLQRATAFLRAAEVPLADPEPRMLVTRAARDAVAGRLAGVRRPLVAMGIGSSEAHRQWGAERMAALGGALLKAGWGSLALIGGPDDGALVTAIQAGLGDNAGRTVPALGWHLAETAALIAAAEFYVGNDTGMMNLAAATGVRSYGLFGASPPLGHSRQIVAVTPPDRQQSPTGMRRISPDAVLAVIQADRGGLAPRPDQVQSQP
ncbi:MAG TPA: glycosyltransferase family 9 protein, partial [Acetobacteraceae bacterium]|nr:glycosyltransferase family 9 protein [Acetobacteraceae bacterium]